MLEIMQRKTTVPAAQLLDRQPGLAQEADDLLFGKSASFTSNLLALGNGLQIAVLLKTGGGVA